MAKANRKPFTHEELMMEAILEGRKSIPEHTDKTDPQVGAIIASKDGKILARAHRGELREGEHCEYTLIERKLKDRNLKDCILYVTLEPCTDEARKKPKRGCCNHIAKARLGKVFIGIEDPNPKIATEGIKYLLGKGIDVKMFPDKYESMIRKDNKQFIREKEAEAIAARKPIILPPKNLLEKPAHGASIESFSSPAINAFLKESLAEFSYPSTEFDQWAQEFQFIEKGKSGQELVPTGLGVILFGNAPQQQFPQTVFKVEIDYGNNQSEIRDFAGPLVLQIGAVLDYVKEKALRWTIERKGKRTVVPDFPFDVLREAISNAIIHRDYSIEGATNYLRISPDKILLRSPGGPMQPLTVNDLQSFDTPSLSRNPKIMYVFNHMKYAEQRGIGLRTMSQLPEMGYPVPVFEMKAGALQIIFNRNTQFKLSDDDKSLMLFVKKTKGIPVSEVAKHFGMTIKTAQRRLNNLVKLKLLKSVGEKRGRKYMLGTNKLPLGYDSDIISDNLSDKSVR